MTLGTSPALTLASARKTAAELHARVRLGEDPAAAKREGQRRAADTVEATLRVYLPEKKATLVPRSHVALERHLLRYAKAGVAGIYNLATYEKEKRTALSMWADHVMAAIEGRTAIIVAMRA